MMCLIIYLYEYYFSVCGFMESIAVFPFFFFCSLLLQELGAARSANPVAQAPSAADADARGVPSSTMTLLLSL